MRTGVANRVDKVVLGTSAFFTTNRQKSVLVEMISLKKQRDCEGDEYCCPMQKRLTWLGLALEQGADSVFHGHLHLWASKNSVHFNVQASHSGTRGRLMQFEGKD